MLWQCLRHGGRSCVGVRPTRGTFWGPYRRKRHKNSCYHLRINAFHLVLSTDLTALSCPYYRSIFPSLSSRLSALPYGLACKSSTSSEFVSNRPIFLDHKAKVSSSGFRGNSLRAETHHSSMRSGRRNMVLYTKYPMSQVLGGQSYVIQRQLPTFIHWRLGHMYSPRYLRDLWKIWFVSCLIVCFLRDLTAVILAGPWVAMGRWRESHKVGQNAAIVGHLLRFQSITDNAALFPLHSLLLLSGAIPRYSTTQRTKYVIHPACGRK